PAPAARLTACAVKAPLLAQSVDGRTDPLRAFLQLPDDVEWRLGAEFLVRQLGFRLLQVCVEAPQLGLAAAVTDALRKADTPGRRAQRGAFRQLVDQLDPREPGRQAGDLRIGGRVQL